MTLTAQGIHKSLGGKAVLRGVDVHVAPGQITGLLGPNGAGKTTLLRILSGLLLPDRGTLELEGRRIDADHESRLWLRERAAFLPDALGLYDRLTAREHIEYYGRLAGMDETILRQRADTLLALLGAQSLASRRVHGFSQGERMKVALARALVHAPQTLILDEATNGLDVHSTRAVRALLARQRSEGRAILFSSHLMHEVAEVCDHVAVISAGRIVGRGTVAELQEQTQTRSLEDAFVALTRETEGPEMQVSAHV